ncbi:MAG: 1-phosphofructokinase [Bacilli bacterium]
MIYTLTLSPSLDYYLDVDNFTKGIINRSKKEIFKAGGKGINVSTVLNQLEIESISLGFLSGFTGDEIERLLNEKHIKSDFVRTRGNSRVNVKVNSESETAINANGPQISSAEISQLLKKLGMLKNGDTLAICGNSPSTLPNDIYKQIMEVIKDKKVRTIVDATGELLLLTLPYHPFLIKPNQEELEEVLNKKLNSVQEIIEGMKYLKSLGARNVIVSRGGDGAIMIDENDVIYKYKAVKGKMLSSVGAGDSLVGGFIAGYMKFGKYEEALKLGMSAGAATAFSNYISNGEKILQIYKQIKERSLDYEDKKLVV